jgi:hypothetical protein
MKLGPDPKQLRDYLGSLVPAAVLTWALAILTASYLGIATKVDAAFISSLVTSVLAVYGISRKEADKKEPTPPQVKRGRPPGTTKGNPPVVSTTQTNGKPQSQP